MLIYDEYDEMVLTF